MSSKERWLTITELAALTRRKQNSIRRHLIEEWALDGKARKVNGHWEVNQAAFDELVKRVQRCEIGKLGKWREPTLASSPIEVPRETPEELRLDNLQALEAGNVHVIEKIVQRVVDGGQKPTISPVDELGHQTVYADPLAKCIRIVAKHTQVLINLQPQGSQLPG